MKRNIPIQWVLSGLVVSAVAAFTIYDLRNELPRADELRDRALEMCARLPKPGMEGRYQDVSACPWTVRAGPKQTFSGILQFDEHGWLFLFDDGAPKPDREAVADWMWNGPKWLILGDHRASQSFDKLNRSPVESWGQAYRVTLRGWRTARAGHFSGRNYDDWPHVLFIDEFIKVEPSDSGFP